MTYIPKGAVKVGTTGSYVPTGAMLVQSPEDYKSKSNVPEIKMNRAGNVVESIANFIGNRTTSTANAAAGGITLNRQTAEANPRITELGQQSRELIARAKAETDPTKKALLLQQSRDLDAQIEAIGSGVTQSTQNVIDKGQITERDLQGSNLDFAGRRAVGVMGEVASFLLPAGKVAKGAGTATKIAQAALTGAKVGGIVGVTDPNAQGIGDRVSQGVKGAATGAAVAGAFAGAGELAKKVSQSITGTSAQAIRRVVKPRVNDAREFKKNFGSKIEDELSKRDAKEIKGMGYDELFDYFDDKYTNAYKEKAKKLAESGKSVKRVKWLGEVQRLKSEVTPENGYVYADDIQRELTRVEDILLKTDPDVPAKNAGNIIRSLQDQVSYSLNTGNAAGEKELKGLIKFFNDDLKETVPGLDQVNKDIQLYRIAKDSVDRTTENEANKVSQTAIDKILQAFPFLVGAGTGVATGDPIKTVGAILLTALPGLARENYRSPEVQTRVASALQKQVPALTNSEISQLTNALSVLANRSVLRNTIPQKEIEPEQQIPTY